MRCYLDASAQKCRGTAREGCPFGGRCDSDGWVRQTRQTGQEAPSDSGTGETCSMTRIVAGPSESAAVRHGRVCSGTCGGGHGCGFDGSAPRSAVW